MADQNYADWKEGDKLCCLSIGGHGFVIGNHYTFKKWGHDEVAGAYSLMKVKEDNLPVVNGMRFERIKKKEEKQMNKFNPGDKVRVLDNDYLQDYVNKEGVIEKYMEVPRDACYVVVEGLQLSFYEHHLELVKEKEFKVGDVVTIYRRVWGHTQEHRAEENEEFCDKEWKNAWIEEMDEYIGNSFTIKSISKEKREVGFKEIEWVFSISSLSFEEKKEEIPVPKFDEMNREELYKQAIHLRIWQRSKMSKEQLLDAVKNAWKPEEIILPKAEPFLGEELREKIKARGYKKRGEADRCSYALKDVKGEKHFYPHDVCHARMRLNIGIAEMCDNIHYLYEDLSEWEKSIYKKAVDYLLNRSPYSKCYKTKDVKKAINDAVYYNVDQLHSYNVASAIALREPSEHKHRLELFDLLLKLGYSEHTAWLGCQAYRKKNNSWVFQGSLDNHASLSGSSLSFDGTIKFFKEGFYVVPGEGNKPSKKNGKDYSIFRSITRFDYVEKSLNKGLQEIFEEKPIEGFMAKASYRNLKDLIPGFNKLEELMKK